MGSSAAQRLSQQLPVEVVSDPLDDVENDPYEDVSDMQRHSRGHQVSSFSDSMIGCLYFCFLHTLVIYF